MIRAMVMVGTLFAASTVLAQPEPQPPPQPEAPVPVDPPEVDAQFQQAMNNFAAGRFAEAAASFDGVAATSNDPARKATAIEMSRQARSRIQATPPADTVETTPPAPVDGRLNQRSRDGRYVLLLGTTLMGVTLYGPTLAVLADSSSEKTSVGMYMLGAGSSFFVPYLLSRDEAISWSMADAWLYGSSRGALHGAFLLMLAGENNDASEQQIFGAMTLASIAEGTGFTLWARETNATAGLTNSMGRASDFGIGYALGLSSIVLPDDSLGTRWVGASGLVGAGLGYGAGYYYGKLRNPTWGDAEVLRTAGILGAYASGVPLILGEVENRHAVALTLMAGATAGLVIGDRLLEGRDFTTGQGVVVELSTLAGGLTGAGLAYLISPEDTSGTTEVKMLATGAVLGAAGGFLLTYNGLDTRVRPSPQSAPSLTLHVAPDLSHDRKGVVASGTF